MIVTEVDENMNPVASREIPDPVEVQIPLMSVRDYFAAAALTSFIGDTTRWAMSSEELAERAYKVADAMMKERDRD